MDIPESAEFKIGSAVIHSVPTAWCFRQQLNAASKGAEGQIAAKAMEKLFMASKVFSIADDDGCTNSILPGMRCPIVHSVGVWESDPEELSFHPAGCMQVFCEFMHENVCSICRQQREIVCQSDFIECSNEGANHDSIDLLGPFGDWQVRKLTSIRHARCSGCSNNTKSLQGLAKKAEVEGALNFSCKTSEAFKFASAYNSFGCFESDHGCIECDHVIIGVGTWNCGLSDMSEIPKSITVEILDGNIRKDVAMWRRFLQYEEGALTVPPETLLAEDGKAPSMIPIDADAALCADVDGSSKTEQAWGINSEADWHFEVAEGSASLCQVETSMDESAVNPVGTSSPEFVASHDFATMWVSALAHCRERFEGMISICHRVSSRGVGCFTERRFPVFDRFCGNTAVMADSNHESKIIEVGHPRADEAIGEPQELRQPFRLDKFAKGKPHSVLNRSNPWC